MLPKTKVIVYGILVILCLFVLDIFRRSRHETTPPPESLLITDYQWREFRESSGKFKALLPSLPQHAAEVVPLPSGEGVIRYDMFLSQEKDGTTFMISQIQYPRDFDTNNPNHLLEGVMSEMLNGNTNNALKSRETAIVNGCPGLDFVIENSDVVIRSRTFLLEKTLYVLTVIDRKSIETKAVFKKFTDSFELGAVAPPSTNQKSST